MKKAKLLTDTLTPDFLYQVMEEKDGFVRLGWSTRGGRNWNETTRPASDVEIIPEDIDPDVYYLSDVKK